MTTKELLNEVIDRFGQFPEILIDLLPEWISGYDCECFIEESDIYPIQKILKEGGFDFKIEPDDQDPSYRRLIIYGE